MAEKRKATFQPYDMDTAAGTNNSGVLMFGYALDGIISNRRLNKDGSYSGVAYYSKVRRIKYDKF